MKIFFLLILVLLLNFNSFSQTKPNNKKPIVNKKPLAINNQLQSSNSSIAIKNPIQIDSTLVIDNSNSTAVVEHTQNGIIDWTNQYIEAKGNAVLDTVRFKISGQAELMAKRGAIVDGQRNLLEIINGVNVISETTVKNMVTSSDYIYTRVDGVIKGAEIIGDPIIKGNIVEVTMRVPLYESKSGKPNLAEVLIDPAKNAVTLKSMNAKTTSNTVNNLDTNTNANPSLFPVVYDENGNIKFDYTKYYDPKSGKFPQYIELAEDIQKQLNIKGGDKVLDVVKNANGQLVVKPGQSEKLSKWLNVGKKIIKYGKFALALI